MRARRAWTRQLVIKLIQERHRQGLRMNGAGVRDDDPSLYFKARFFFGKNGWKKALKKAGLDPALAESGKELFWTVEILDAVLRALHELGIPLSEQFLRKHGLRPIYEAGIARHGSLKKAIESIGLDYDTVRERKAKGFWSKRRVITEIKRLKKAGVQLNLHFIQFAYGGLYAAAYTYWGGWPNAVEAAGLDYIAESKHFPINWWLRSLQQNDLERIRKNVTRFAQERIDHEQDKKQKRGRCRRRNSGQHRATDSDDSHRKDRRGFTHSPLLQR